MSEPQSSAASASSASAAAAAPSSTGQSGETVDLAELLSVCVTLVSHAGESIRRIFDSGNLGAVDKDASGAAVAAAGGKPDPQYGLVDPQTLADLESQRIIIGNLVRLWPHLTIVGEEGELDNATGGGGKALAQRGQAASLTDAASFPAELRAVPIEDVAVWVDPLDGTREFTLGYVHYVTVLVGVSVRGRATAGVVHVPFTGGQYKRKHDPLYEEAGHGDDKAADEQQSSAPGQTIWGAVGAGVHGLTIPPASSVPVGRRWITTTRTHMSARLQGILDSMRPERVIRCGGAGSKGLLVLARQADAYVYPQAGTKRWDSAAIDALVRAAGGCFTDGFGRDILYDPRAKRFDNDAGILATMNQDNHKLYALTPPPAAEEEANSGAAASTAGASAAKANL